MQRGSTRSGRSYGADPAVESASGDEAGGPRVHPRVHPRDDPGTSAGEKAPPKQRPLLRGWINILSIPYSVLLAYHLVLCAPTAGSAKAAIFSCFCSAVGYAVSGYYHAVTHTPAWRAYVRKFDHAAIFLTIAGTYTPFVYRAYENIGASWVLGLLVAEWLLALMGMANSAGGLVPNMTKLHRTLMYIAVSWIPVPAAGFAFGWSVYRWIALGGLVYMTGGLMYGLQWPDPVPGVLGHHELLHLAIVVANTLMMKGLEQAFVLFV